MTDILSLLKELLPVWALMLVAGFGYLLILFKRASDRFLDLASKQADYLKDRVEVVDKSTGIFARTIDQQEKEILRLTDQVARLGGDLQNARETDARLSRQELEVLSESIEFLSTDQQDLRRMLAKLPTTTLSQLTPGSADESVKRALETGIPNAIRARDLSVYSIVLTRMSGASALVDRLREKGYAASLYPAEDGSDEPSKCEGIWLGAAIPASIAINVIGIVRNAWPFLKYVHLSSDSDSAPDSIHTQIYVGGATLSATTFLGCRPWTDLDFANLRSDMSNDELHNYVRSRYKA